MNRRLLLSFVLLMVPATAIAQTDTIYLTDGTTIDRARLEDFTCRKVEYRRGRDLEETPRAKVLRIELGQPKVTNHFKTAEKYVADEAWASAYQSWLEAGEKALESKDLAPFAQFAYWNALQVAIKSGTDKDRVETIATLEAKVPETGFLPDLWRFRLDRAKAMGSGSREGLENYKAAVTKYKEIVAEKEMGDRYLIEADLYLIDARALLRELDPQGVQDALSRLLPRAENTFPDLAARINLEAANAVLAAQKFEEARKLFSGICGSKTVDDDTRGHAFLGRGHTWLRLPSLTAEDAKRALFDYMRVIILFPDVDDELVGEALYHAAKAYDAWNGPDAQTNVRRLRSRLLLRYAETTWAKK